MKVVVDTEENIVIFSFIFHKESFELGTRLKKFFFFKLCNQ
jgi:hypothetical protein